MSIKEYLKHSAQSFFIVVTLINAAMMFLGKAFYPSQQLSYDMYKYPILYGLCSMIPVIIMYSKNELTIKQLLVRKLIQMLLIMLLLVLMIFGFDGLSVSNIGKIAGVSASVAVIYVLEGAISWIVNTHDAERLTESLHKYQEVLMRTEYESEE